MVGCTRRPWYLGKKCVLLCIMHSDYTVLLVEDDPSVAKGLLHGLKEEGFSVVHAATGKEALNLLREAAAHIVLLDIRLPDMSGFDVCRICRERQHTLPVIMLTARDGEVDRVLGLEIGADDYIVKPFSFRELVSRIRAQLRRAYGTFKTADSEALVYGDLTVDRRRVTVLKKNRPVDLTPLEYKILVMLMENEGIPIARNRIIELVWGYDIFLGDERTVDVHIRRLREKIEEKPGEPELILTVRGFGYRFNSNP